MYCHGGSSGRLLAQRSRVSSRLRSRNRKQLPAGGFVLAHWSSCRGSRRAAASELAVAPTTTSGSRSSSAWAGRPHQPVTRHNQDQALLRAFHCVPSKVGVCANAPTTDEPTLRAAVQMIECAAESGIGPISPILTSASNSHGGVMGKMIDAQSIVVSSTATGQVEREVAIFGVVFAHREALACLSGAIVLVYVCGSCLYIVHARRSLTGTNWESVLRLPRRVQSIT